MWGNGVMLQRAYAYFTQFFLQRVALRMLQGLWHSPAGFWQSEQMPWWGLLGIAALVWGLSPRALRWQRLSVAWLARLGPWLGGGLLALLWCVLLYGAPEGVPSFIYYRF